MKCTVYGKTVTKTYKTFLATCGPVGGVIRVAIVKEEHDWLSFFSTDPQVSAAEIVEAFADRVINGCHLLIGEESDVSSEAVVELRELSCKAYPQFGQRSETSVFRYLDCLRNRHRPIPKVTVPKTDIPAIESQIRPTPEPFRRIP